MPDQDDRIRRRLLFLFPHPIADEHRRVVAGESPSERLYGAHELAARGWSVSFCDSRFRGVWGRILRFFGKFGVVGLDFGTLRAMAAADVVIVKDEFSAPIAVATRLLGKKLVFLDSMFRLPKRWWKALGTRVSLALAHEVIGYSHFQKAEWQAKYGSLGERIRVLPYTIDVNFYARQAPPQGTAGTPPRILAVGRDVGRDYKTLLAAVRDTTIELDLVTLPYTLKGASLPETGVTLHQRVSYAELFELYAQCAVVVVPLQGGLTYPSGIRALLESMAMRRPFVTTRNPVLEEYVSDGTHGVMVEAADPAALRFAMLALLEDAGRRRSMAAAAEELLKAKYGMSSFVDRFDELLIALTRS